MRSNGWTHRRRQNYIPLISLQDNYYVYVLNPFLATVSSACFHNIYGGRNPEFCVWVHLGMEVCHIPFLASDLISRIIVSVAYLLY